MECGEAVVCISVGLNNNAPFPTVTVSYQSPFSNAVFPVGKSGYSETLFFLLLGKFVVDFGGIKNLMNGT